MIEIHNEIKLKKVFQKAKWNKSFVLVKIGQAKKKDRERE